MRLNEFGVNNNNTSNSNLRVMPIPEGRMRLQEQSRYAVSLQANISYGQQSSTKKYESSPHEAYEAVEVPRSLSNKPIAKPISKRPPTKPNNPFDDEDSYDESKNPFADESDGNDDSNDRKPNNRNSGNRSKDYDSNLNPFS